MSRYIPFFFSFPAGLLTALLQVLPLAAARYNDFTKGDTPFAVVVLADGFYLSSGFLRYTRPYFLPHRVDSFDNQSIVLDTEIPNDQTHLSSSGVVSNNPVMELKPADPVYEAPGIVYHRNRSSGVYPLTTSPVRDNTHMRDASAGDGATNIDDDDI